MKRSANFSDRLDAVLAYDRRNKPANFREAAEALVRDFPKSSSAWLQLGIAHTDIANYDEARKALQKSIKFSSKRFMHVPYYCKGLMYKEKGDLKLAEKWFRKSIELTPKEPDAHAFLGATLAKQGRYNEAKSEWRKMIRLSKKVSNPVTEEGHFNLGLIYRAEKRYKDALKQADKALALDPQYKWAKNLRSDLLEVLGDQA